MGFFQILFSLMQKFRHVFSCKYRYSFQSINLILLNISVQIYKKDRSKWENKLHFLVKFYIPRNMWEENREIFFQSSKSSLHIKLKQLINSAKYNFHREKFYSCKSTIIIPSNVIVNNIHPGITLPGPGGFLWVLIPIMVVAHLTTIRLKRYTFLR